jgi:hypothetical protein
MTIKTDVTPEWKQVLETLTPDEQAVLIKEAEHLASALSYRNNNARISTNGALEILFAIGCEQNRYGCSKRI